MSAALPIVDDCLLRVVDVPDKQRNALRVEMAANPRTPRCMAKPPAHWPAAKGADPIDMSIRWIGSGGSSLVFGACTPDHRCPKFDPGRSK